MEIVNNTLTNEIPIDKQSSLPPYSELPNEIKIDNLKSKLFLRRLKYLYKKIDESSHLLWNHENSLGVKKRRSEIQTEDNQLKWKDRDTTQTGYGEITMGSMTNMFNLFQNVSLILHDYHPEVSHNIIKEYDLSDKSAFLDIGSGFGKPNFHAALQTGCISKGIEVVPARAEYCIDFFWENFSNRNDFFNQVDEEFIKKNDNLISKKEMIKLMSSENGLTYQRHKEIEEKYSIYANLLNGDTYGVGHKTNNLLLSKKRKKESKDTSSTDTNTNLNLNTNENTNKNTLITGNNKDKQINEDLFYITFDFHFDDYFYKIINKELIDLYSFSSKNSDTDYFINKIVNDKFTIINSNPREFYMRLYIENPLLKYFNIKKIDYIHSKFISNDKYSKSIFDFNSKYSTFNLSSLSIYTKKKSFDINILKYSFGHYTSLLNPSSFSLYSLNSIGIIIDDVSNCFDSPLYNTSYTIESSEIEDYINNLLEKIIINKVFNTESLQKTLYKYRNFNNQTLKYTSFYPIIPYIDNKYLLDLVNDVFSNENDFLIDNIPTSIYEQLPSSTSINYILPKKLQKSYYKSKSKSSINLLKLIDEISEKERIILDEKIQKISKDVIHNLAFNYKLNWSTSQKISFKSEDATKCFSYTVDSNDEKIDRPENKMHFSHIYSYNKLMSKECRGKICQILNNTDYKVLAWYSNPIQTKNSGLKDFEFLCKFPMQSTSTEKFHVYVYIKKQWQ